VANVIKGRPACFVHRHLVVISFQEVVDVIPATTHGSVIAEIEVMEREILRKPLAFR